MAVVITLDQYRHSAVHRDGTVFPMVYRVTGCGTYYTNQKRTRWKPDRSNPMRCYRLSPPDEPSSSKCEPMLAPDMVEVQCEAITHLDPVCGDHGVVIVRHHRDIEVAEAYCNGLDDNSGEPDDFNRKMWRTPSGVFTLHHRAAVPGRRDCLLVYAAFAPGKHRPWHHIVASDGSVLGNDYDLASSFRAVLEIK